MKINFYAKNKLVKEVIPPPRVVKVPGWFKEIPVYSNNETNLNIKNGETNYSVKSCVPFLDTFSTGYVFELWCDIKVSNQNGYPYITWINDDPELSPVLARPDAYLPIDDGFWPFTFSWVSKWGIKTPKGYSCLFTHPLNRTDLPFITTSGIMDTDSWGIWGNQPFALKKDFEGIIEAGTPIIQFIPFKREKWESVVEDDLVSGEVGFYENIRRTSKIRGYYKNNHWTRKEYK